MRIYLASPLGFAESTRLYLAQLIACLRGAGHEVFDPWDTPEGAQIAAALALEDSTQRLQLLVAANHAVGTANEQGIGGADVVFAVLDGVDVDSGTASEIGFGYGTGKRIFGLRTDSRRTGDNEGATVNLQVEYWINASGGRIFASLAEVEGWAAQPE